MLVFLNLFSDGPTSPPTLASSSSGSNEANTTSDPEISNTLHSVSCDCFAANHTCCF